MRNKKGFTLVEVISAIVILSIIITLGVFSITKVRSNILEKQYKNIKLEIELAAEKYYSDTESKEVYVDTLIKEGYLKADNKSMTITDPRDKTSLNCHIVTINDNEEGNLGIESNIDENGNCNEEAIVNSEISIVDIDGNKINKTWYKSPITLKVKFNNSEKEPNSYDYTWKSEKNPNVISDEPIYNLENLYNERGYVIDDEFYVTLVNAEETLESKGQRVRIDGVLPEIKSLVVLDIDKWTKDKTLKVNATDVGSGIESYILSMGDCESIPLEKYNKIPDIPNPNDVKIEQKITKNGTYTFCASDKAGNKVKYKETISIDKIDDIPPVCSYIENTKWTKSNVAISFGCVDNESGCSKLTYKKKTTNCNGTCYKTYTYTSTYKSANISKTIGSFTIEDNAGNIVTCPSDKKEVNVYLDKDKPVISNINISSNQLNYNSRYTKVSFTLTDNHSGISSFCIGTSKNNCNTKSVNSYCTQNGNRYDCSVDYTFTSSDGSGNTEYVYITAYDNVNNFDTQKEKYELYKSCTFTDFERYGKCSEECDGGVYYEYRTDKYLGISCNSYGDTPCNTNIKCCDSTYSVYSHSGSCSNTCGNGRQRVYYELYSKINDKYCGQDYDYIDCYEESGCYVPEPDPTPDPNPGGGGGSSCKPSTINGNRCDTTHDILYYISTCCGGECNYSAKAGNVEYGTISQSLLQGASKCSSYGEPPAPSKPTCSYVNVGCAGNGHDYGTKNCTCGHGYGGYQCGCKCPRGCVE